MVRNVKVKDSLGCRDHETVHFLILSEVRKKAESQVWTSREQIPFNSGTTWLDPMGHFPGGQRGLGGPADLQGQPSQSTKMAQHDALLSKANVTESQHEATGNI